MTSTAFGRVISTLVVGPAEELESMLPKDAPSMVARVDGAAHAIVSLAVKPYDLVLIDHTAEGDVTEEQLAYLRALRAIRPATKVIVLVSHSTTRKVLEALSHGVFAYFSRPFASSDVRDVIAQAFSILNWSNGIELLSAAPDFVSVRLRCCVLTADRLTQFMRELPCDLQDQERTELSIAFREMLLNAIEHGGKLDPDEWVCVSRVRTRRVVIYHIHDPGEGFSIEDLQHAAIFNAPGEPTAHMDVRMEKNMRPGGFGILITSHSVDEVIYNQTGNEVILIKHLDQGS